MRFVSDTRCGDNAGLRPLLASGCCAAPRGHGARAVCAMVKAQASQLPHAAGAGEANRVLVLFFVSGDRNRLREIPGCPLCHPPNSQATRGPALVFT